MANYLVPNVAALVLGKYRWGEVTDSKCIWSCFNDIEMLESMTILLN